MKLTTSHRVQKTCHAHTTQVQYVRPKSIDNNAPARRELLIEADYIIITANKASMFGKRRIFIL